MQQLFSHGYALLIGIGADLPETVRDVHSLYHVLTNKQQAAYPKRHVFLRTGLRATSRHIMVSLDTLITRANADLDATVIIYFSGHGYRIFDEEGQPSYFLVPHRFDPDRLPETAISGSEFSRKVAAIRTRKVIVLLDCCHADGMLRLKAPDEQRAGVLRAQRELVQALGAGNGRIIIGSSRAEEPSFGGGVHSLFTSCLLEALEGYGNLNGNDRYVRIMDVIAYLLEQVPARTSQEQHAIVNHLTGVDDNFPVCSRPPSQLERCLPLTQPKQQWSAVSAEVPVVPRSLEHLAWRRHRLLNEQQAWNVQVQKLRQLIDVEPDIAERLRLEHTLEQDERELRTVEDKLVAIDQQIAKQKALRS